MLITSLENKKIKRIVKLKNKKYRDKENLFIAEIPNIIKEANSLGLLKELYVKEGYNLDISFNYDTVDEKVMNKIKTLPISNVLGIIEKPKTGVLKGDKYIILDNIQDPGNLGTIVRSALGFGIDTLIISNNSCDLYNDKVIRATEGAIFKLNIVIGDLIPIIEQLQKDNINIYKTDVKNGEDISTINDKKIAIIMGNEGTGISKDIKDIVKNNIYIKTKNIESLNVGVATSIIMYEISK